MPKYLVKGVRTGKKPASEAQYADLEDEANEFYKGVYIKEWGSALEVGNFISGEIVRGQSKFNEGETYLYLKTANFSSAGETGGQPRQVGESGAVQGVAKQFPTRDATGRSIERQVALKAAVELGAADAAAGKQVSAAAVLQTAAEFDLFLAAAAFPGAQWEDAQNNGAETPEKVDALTGDDNAPPW